eukprot:450561_1
MIHSLVRNFGISNNRHCIYVTLFPYNIQIRSNTSPFPLRPQYGLGSMLPPGLIAGMKKEADVRTKITVLDQMENDIESTQRELLIQKNQVTNSLSSAQTLPPVSGLQDAINQLQETRKKVVQDKVSAYGELANVQITAMDDDDTDPDSHEGFSTFDSSIESPVDWGNSVIDYIERAEDNIIVSAEFYDTNMQQQAAYSTADNAAYDVKRKVHGSWGSRHSSHISSTVHHNLSQTYSQHVVESTLLVTAFATHRFVKQFNPLHVDTTKLVNAWNYYNKNDKIDTLTLSFQDLEKAIQDSKAGKSKSVAMVTEEFLGSCLIGMVHYIKKDRTDSIQAADSSSYKSHTTDHHLKVTWHGWWIFAWCTISAVTGNSSAATQAANKFAQSSSSSDIDVKFHLLCYGYQPKLEPNVINDAIKSFKNFSPDKMDAQNDTNLMPNNASTSQLLSMNRGQGKKESQSGAMIKSTIMGLKDAYSHDYKVLDNTTFMNAFDDYAKNAPKIKGSGIPIGMNIKTWNKEKLIRMILQERLAAAASPINMDSTSTDDDNKDEGENQ